MLANVRQPIRIGQLPGGEATPVKILDRLGTPQTRCFLRCPKSFGYSHLCNGTVPDPLLMSSFCLV